MMRTTDSRTFTYQVGLDGRILWVNDAWLAFGRENGADYTSEAVVDQPLWAFIAGEDTRHLYELLLARARSTGETITIPFRCDSPDCRRFLEMEIAAVSPDVTQFSNRVLRMEPREPVPLLDPDIRRSDKFLTICSWCKKVCTDPDRWIEVEEAVQNLRLFDNAALPNLTHGICRPCRNDMLREEAT